MFGAITMLGVPKGVWVGFRNMALQEALKVNVIAPMALMQATKKR